MCGFFSFSTGFSPREIADMLDIDNLPRNEQDVALFKEQLESMKFYPKALIPTVSKNSPNKLLFRYWSIIPRWWKENPEDLRFSTFNARGEELREKATYRSPWKDGYRCLIPSTWFYEFHPEKIDTKTIKVPYRVQVPNVKFFTIAGLYEKWKNKQDEEIETVTIITTAAIEPLSKIHDRQPVIIEEKDREKWLSKDSSPDEAYKLIKPTKKLEYFQINHSFNKTFGHNVTTEMVSPLSNK